MRLKGDSARFSEFADETGNEVGGIFAFQPGVGVGACHHNVENGFI